MSIARIPLPDSRVFGTIKPRLGMRRINSKGGLQQPLAKMTAQQQISILREWRCNGNAVEIKCPL
jgi:hypothetical protein